MGAGEWEVPGRVAQVFADRILPDVAGYRFEAIGAAKDMVVIAHLPEREAAGLAKLGRSAKFEDAHELAEIRAWRGAFRQEMEVVGHQAVGVELKIVTGGTFAQAGGHAGCDTVVRKMRAAEVAADGYEIRLLTNVVGVSKARGFAGVVHTMRLYDAGAIYTQERASQER